MRNKKGQTTVGGLPMAIVGIVVAIIILVIGLVIIQDLRDTSTIKAGESGTLTNSTNTVDTGGADILTFPACVLTVSHVENQSWGQIITSGNYTVSNCKATATTTAGMYNNTAWNISGTYTFGGETYSAANNSLIGLGTFGDFVPLIVLAIAAAVIIGLILAGFAYSSRRR